MERLEKLKTIAVCVENILISNKQAREDDFILYYLVIKELGVKLPLFKGFGYVLSNHTKYNLPAFESVSRARRQVCKLHPELKGSNNAHRVENEKIYKDFSTIKEI